MADKKRISAELSPEDMKCVELIQKETGIFTVIGAIRYALYETRRQIKHRKSVGLLNATVAAQASAKKNLEL